MKQRILPVILGIGMAVTGLMGCQSSLSGVGIPKWRVPDPEPATSVRVFLTASASTGAKLDGVKLLLLSSFSKTRLDSIDIDVASDTTTQYFTGLSQGAYIVYIEKSGYTRQSVVVDLAGPIIPTASFLVKMLVTTTTVTVGAAVPIVSSAPTVATVEAPSSVSDGVENDTQVEVTLPIGTGVTGEIALVSQTGSETPAITDDYGAVTSTVLSAVEIQVGSAGAGDIASVALPLPFDSTAVLAAVGSTVDLVVFDPTAMTWLSAGTATINEDGLAVGDVTLTGANTLVAVAVKPDVSTLSSSSSSESELSEQSVKDLLASGESVYTYEQNPTVSVTSSKLGRSMTLSRISALIDPPSGVDAGLWALIAPSISQIEPNLSSWINGGVTVTSVALPTTNGYILNNATDVTFNVQFRFGGVTKTYTIRLRYTKAEVIIISHSAGDGTAS
jgi:hypothetical protein